MRRPTTTHREIDEISQNPLQEDGDAFASPPPPPPAPRGNSDSEYRSNSSSSITSLAHQYDTHAASYHPPPHHHHNHFSNNNIIGVANANTTETSLLLRRPMTAGTRRTATTAPMSDADYDEQLRRNRRFRDEAQEDFFDEHEHRNQQLETSTAVTMNTPRGSVSNFTSTSANNDAVNQRIDFSANAPKPFRQQQQQQQQQQHDSGSRGRFTGEHNNKNNSNSTNCSSNVDSVPNPTEVNAFQRTMQMLARLQQQQQQLPPQQQQPEQQSNRRRPQSARSTGAANRTIIDHNNNNYSHDGRSNNNTDFYSNDISGTFGQQPQQRPHSARRSTADDVIDTQFNKMFHFSSSGTRNAASSAFARLQRNHRNDYENNSLFNKINARVVPQPQYPATNHNLTTLSSSSTSSSLPVPVPPRLPPSFSSPFVSAEYVTLQQKQQSQLSNTSLFLEQTQAELEKVSNEKHSLQRLVLELQKENEVLKIGHGQVLADLERSRQREVDLDNALQEMDGQMQELAAAMEEQRNELENSRISNINNSNNINNNNNNDSSRQQEEHQEQCEQQKQRYDSSTISSSAIEKAIFIVTGNFPPEIVQSLFVRGNDHSDDNRAEVEDEDDSAFCCSPSASSGSSSINLDELMNFLADRCIELCAARQQLTHYAQTHDEMMQLADQWDEREKELMEDLEAFQAELDEKEYQIRKLQLQLQQSADSSGQEFVSNSSDTTKNNNDNTNDTSHVNNNNNNDDANNPLDKIREIVEHKLADASRARKVNKNNSEAILRQQLAAISSRNNDTETRTKQRQQTISSSLVEELLHEAESQMEKLHDSIQHHQARLGNQNNQNQNNQQQRLIVVEPSSAASSSTPQTTVLWGVPADHWSNKPYKALSHVISSSHSSPSSATTTTTASKMSTTNDTNGASKNVVPAADNDDDAAATLEFEVSNLVHEHLFRSRSASSETPSSPSSSSSTSSFDALELWKEIVSTFASKSKIKVPKSLLLVETGMLIAEHWGIIKGGHAEDDDDEGDGERQHDDGCFVPPPPTTRDSPLASAHHLLLQHRSNKKSTSSSSSASSATSLPSSINTISSVALHKLLQVISQSYFDDDDNDDDDGENSNETAKNNFHSSLHATNVLQQVFALLQSQHELARKEHKAYDDEFCNSPFRDDADEDDGVDTINGLEDDDADGDNFYYPSSFGEKKNSKARKGMSNNHKRNGGGFDPSPHLSAAKQEEGRRRRNLLRPSIIATMTLEERLALLLSACAISIGHPNVTEEYLIRTRDPIAIRYNTNNNNSSNNNIRSYSSSSSSSSSILSNYHIATLLSLDEAVSKEVVAMAEMTMRKKLGKNLDNEKGRLPSSPSVSSPTTFPFSIIFSSLFSSSSSPSNSAVANISFDQILQRFQHLIVTFMSIANTDNIKNFPSSVQRIWNFVEDEWNNGNTTFESKVDSLLRNFGEKKIQLVGWLLAGAKAKSMLVETKTNSEAASSSTYPWISILRENCVNQRLREQDRPSIFVASPSTSSSAVSSDLPIKTSSLDAELRSIIWMFDAKIIPLMNLMDCIVGGGTATTNNNNNNNNNNSNNNTADVHNLAAASVAARNVYAGIGNLPLISLVGLNLEQQHQQAKLMMVGRARSSADWTSSGGANNDDSLVASREEIEAMKWSFAEIQKSLLQTIAEYQDALSAALEEKKILTESTTEMTRNVTARNS